MLSCSSLRSLTAYRAIQGNWEFLRNRDDCPVTICYVCCVEVERGKQLHRGKDGAMLYLGDTPTSLVLCFWLEICRKILPGILQGIVVTPRNRTGVPTSGPRPPIFHRKQHIIQHKFVDLRSFAQNFSALVPCSSLKYDRSLNSRN